MPVSPGDLFPLWDLSSPYDRPGVETVSPARRDANCSKCSLHENVDPGQRCIKPRVYGESGPVMLVVGGWPTTYEAEKGEPFLGELGRKIREVVFKNWPGRVVFDYGIKCPTKNIKPHAMAYQMCQPYLARTLEFFDYDRIVLVGRDASRSYLGRTVDIDSVDRPWAWSPMHDCPVYPITGIKSASYNTRDRDRLFSAVKRVCLEPRPQRPEFDAQGWRISPELWEELEEWATGAESLVLDVETEGRLYDDDFRIVSAALGRRGSKVVWSWFAEDMKDGSPTAAMLYELLTEFPIDAHNRNYENQAVRSSLGVQIDGGKCSMLIYKLLVGNARVALANLQDVIGMGGSKDELGPHLSAARAVIRQEAEADHKLSDDPVAAAMRDPRVKDVDTYSYGRVNQEVLARYNCRDTFTTVKLLEWEEREFAKPENQVFSLTWDDHVGPLSEACTYMESVGLRAIRGHARSVQRYFGDRITRMEAELARWSPINWGSGDQVAAYLYGECGLEVPWLTETGKPSTDKYALAKLAKQHGAIPLLLKKRQIDTLNKTYAWGIDRYIQDDGRVHTSFKVHGTETGRPSSANPNQQNLPRAKTPLGKLIKNLYIASKGRVLLVFDHSTLEIRVVAGVSGDQEMLRILNSGVDFHLETAKLIAPIFGLDPSTITKEHWLRDVAKTLNFALLYGKSDTTAADDLDVAVSVASDTRRAILGTFTGLNGWIDGQHDRVRSQGGVWIHRSGGVRSRFRPLPGIFSRSRKMQSNALNAAVNTPIQGGGAEINNGGLIACREWLRGPIGRYVSMPLAVHDSIVFDVDKFAVDEVLDVVPRLMTAFDIGAPLVVDAAQGDKLGSVEAVKL